MPSISEAICELHAALDSNTNENQLVELIEQRLSFLRASYREHWEEFKDEDIQFLKSLVPLQEALREFIEAIEDKRKIRTREDARELADCFSEIRERLNPHLVVKRVDKEIREVIAGMQSLPFTAVVTGDAALLRRVGQLQSNAQPCHKCGSKMVLREGPSGYFWGCGSFPRCFSRRGLSTEDSKFLYP